MSERYEHPGLTIEILTSDTLGFDPTPNHCDEPWEVFEVALFEVREDYPLEIQPGWYWDVEGAECDTHDLTLTEDMGGFGPYASRDEALAAAKASQG